MTQTTNAESNKSKAVAPPVAPELLQQLAIAHRRVVLSVLLKLLYFAFAFLLVGIGIMSAEKAQDTGIAGNLLFGYWIVVLVYSLIAVYKLADLLKKEQGIGILYAGLMFVPVVGLIVLLSLSQKSIKILRRYGVKVRLMGADLSTIDHSSTEVTPIDAG